jgi:hypothetical protein
MPNRLHQPAIATLFAASLLSSPAAAAPLHVSPVSLPRRIVLVQHGGRGFTGNSWFGSYRHGGPGFNGDYRDYGHGEPSFPMHRGEDGPSMHRYEPQEQRPLFHGSQICATAVCLPCWLEGTCKWPQWQWPAWQWHWPQWHGPAWQWHLPEWQLHWPQWEWPWRGSGNQTSQQSHPEFHSNSSQGDNHTLFFVVAGICGAGFLAFLATRHHARRRKHASPTVRVTLYAGEGRIRLTRHAPHRAFS